MEDFVHLHVHTQYSLLDGQAAIPKLVDKAVKNGMRGMAITDHGNMMGVKEYFNYMKKIRGKFKDGIKEIDAKMASLQEGIYERAEEEKSLSDDQLREGWTAEREKLQKKMAFKPIFGCEMYVARRTMRDKQKEMGDSGGAHLVVLAKNSVGYHNLIKLVSNAWVDGFYMRPRTDHTELEKYHEGLIVCSACIAGEVPRAILKGDIAEAERLIQWYKNLFGDDYYLELQRHRVTDPNQRANRETYPLQQQANAVLIELARKYGVKLVCTNDCHFVDEENAEAHDRLICLATGKDLDDPKRMLYSKQEWFKTREEMNAIFADVPEALANTCEVCDKVEEYDIDHGPIMPNFEIPEEFGTEEEYRKRITEKELFDEFTQDENGNVVLSEEDANAKIKKLGGYNALYRIKLEADYLAKLAYDGAYKIYGNPLDPEVDERIKFELHIMKTMGFPGYFLIVQDYIAAARQLLGVSVGPGRGSAAGSAVAYCLGITKVDPIKYDLLFERFLNPDRISLPDIDVDFDDDGRGKVLQWVTQKYGAEKVAHIITYGTMATKSAIKDVARVEKLPLDESNRLCKLIPDKLPEDANGKVPKMNLPNAIAAIPELQHAEVSPDPKMRDTIRYAKMLEGNVRNTGVHACGVIICRDAISDWVPVSTADDKETGEKLICTQYEGKVIEETGLIKMDFLGLKTLSIIKEAVENIRLSLGKDVDVDTIDINDPATYRLYCEGRTIGTFQFESPGMQKYLRELQPSTFEDLIAMNALYRPGPMDYIPDFIDRKLGRKPVVYDIPCMEKYLKDTYGITVYQEQVMLLSRQLANFTRGESDTLRKAMGKKLIEKLNHMYPKFIKGGQANGHDPKILEKIWADWKKFASYAFNKSHATCYSWVAYQTAYLKANYPSQYMAAVMSRSLANIADITKLMDECKSMGINTLGPDVNESYLKFSVNSHCDIRFGLGAVKGVGTSAVQTIVEERTKNGPYKDIFDFVQRVNLSACNRKNIECLALAGAFDGFNQFRREQIYAKNAKGDMFIDTLLRYGQVYQSERQAAENSLFGGFDDMDVEIATPEIPETEEWSLMERLSRERDLVGIYLSAHPLDAYAVVLNYVCNTKAVELMNDDKSELMERQEVKVGGIVSSVRRGMSKTGKPYGIVKLEDDSGVGELPLFGEDWVRWGNFMIEGNTIFVLMQVVPGKWKPEQKELRVTQVEFLADVQEKRVERITIQALVDNVNVQVADEILALVNVSKGNTELCFDLVDSESHHRVQLRSPERITVGKSLLRYVEEHEGMKFKING
jgi:DNA polymerase-3 subunit alpha